MGEISLIIDGGVSGLGQGDCVELEICVVHVGSSADITQPGGYKEMC